METGTVRIVVFKTNSEYNLKNHEQTTGHKIWEETAIKVGQPSIKCNICQKEFPNENEIALHKRKDHKSFKPCRNLPNCPYMEVNANSTINQQLTNLFAMIVVKNFHI